MIMMNLSDVKLAERAIEYINYYLIQKCQSEVMKISNDIDEYAKSIIKKLEHTHGPAPSRTKQYISNLVSSYTWPRGDDGSVYYGSLVAERSFALIPKWLDSRRVLGIIKYSKSKSKAVAEGKEWLRKRAKK